MKTKRPIIIGGGAAGLSAAWTLRKRGIKAILFEANDRLGGRLGGDRMDGFFLDEGADFFCSSYDVAFRICQELGLPLIRSDMNLGWYRNGQWIKTTPIKSFGALIRNLPALWKLGLLSAGFLKLARAVKTESEYLNFASDSRIIELDGEENAGDYLKRIGLPESLKTTLRGFLEMTMGDVDQMGAAYMRTYIAEMLLKADQIYVPEKGAGELSHALADACGADIRTSMPVRRVVIQDGSVTGVLTDDGLIEADAVICATSASKAPDIIPDLPNKVLRVLGKVRYSRGCRVVIGLDAPPLPPGWHGALYPEDDTPLLLDRSINLPACVPPGKSTLDLLVGRDRAEELFPLDDQEIKRKLLADVRRNPPPGSNLPGDEEGLFTRVYRWKEAVCMGLPGMFKEVVEMRRQLNRDLKNLFLAGDYMRVPSVNGALASGVDAAEEVVELFEARPV
ncbi:MAG: NAD(P)-binding protein [Opitutae bacterium]|nr:NAD(P)-binding protein [Opitutae bacterium]